MMMLRAAALLTAVTVAGEAMAAQDIIFYDKPDCRGYTVTGMDSTVPRIIDCSYDRKCANDEIASVWLGPSVRPGTVIYVYDSSKADKRDDWARVSIHRYIQDDWGKSAKINNRPIGFGMCVGSFEENFNAANYEIYYRRRDNLNGKVSRIVVQPGRE